MDIAELKKRVFDDYMSPFSEYQTEIPPPLKHLVPEIARGEPAEKRHLEEQLKEQKRRVAELEVLMQTLKKTLTTKTAVEELQTLNLSAESAETPEDLFRIIAQEKAQIRRDKEELDRARDQFEKDKRVLLSAESAQATRVLQSMSPTLTMGAVIAQKVAQYMTTLEGCSKQELKEIRVGLEEMLLQKLNELD